MGIEGNNIVGTYEDLSNNGHSFLYDGSTFITLNDPNAGPPYETVAWGVSGNKIVGVSGTSGFIYDGSTYKDVSYPGASQTEFVGISGNMIVGHYYYTAGGAHSFLYDGTTFTPIVDPLGVEGTLVSGISGNKIVGSYRDSVGNFHGFLYDGSTYATILGASGLTGIDGNTVIGVDSDGSFIATPLGNWIGSNSSAWSDNGNWGGAIPGATTGTTNPDTATFDQNAPNSPLTIDAGRNISDITFDTANVNSLTIGTVGGQRAAADCRRHDSNHFHGGQCANGQCPARAGRELHFQQRRKQQFRHAQFRRGNQASHDQRSHDAHAQWQQYRPEHDQRRLGRQWLRDNSPSR